MSLNTPMLFWVIFSSRQKHFQRENQWCQSTILIVLEMRKEFGPPEYPTNDQQ